MLFRYGPSENQYPDIVSYKYPKPGTPNPHVTVHVVDVAAPHTSTAILEPPPEVDHNEYIVSSAAWQPKSSIFHVTWLNRPQNVTVYTACYPDPQFKHELIDDVDVEHNRWPCLVLYVDVVRRGWAAPLKHPWFSQDGSEFLQILPTNYIHHAHNRISFS